MDWTQIVVKVLSNNNYVVRRTGTRYTQTLHRIRLRLYAPNQRVLDVTVRREDYLPDPEVKTTHNDWYAQAWETEFGEVLFGNTKKTPLKKLQLQKSQTQQEMEKVQRTMMWLKQPQANLQRKMTWLKQPQAKLQWKMTWFEQPQMKQLKGIEHTPTTSRHLT